MRTTLNCTNNQLLNIEHLTSIFVDNTVDSIYQQMFWNNHCFICKSELIQYGSGRIILLTVGYKEPDSSWCFELYNKWHTKLNIWTLKANWINKYKGTYVLVHNVLWLCYLFENFSVRINGIYPGSGKIIGIRIRTNLQ